MKTRIKVIIAIASCIAIVVLIIVLVSFMKNSVNEIQVTSFSIRMISILYNQIAKHKWVSEITLGL